MVIPLVHAGRGTRGEASRERQAGRGTWAEARGQRHAGRGTRGERGCVDGEGGSVDGWSVDRWRVDGWSEREGERDLLYNLCPRTHFTPLY